LRPWSYRKAVDGISLAVITGGKTSKMRIREVPEFHIRAMGKVIAVHVANPIR